MFQVAILAVLCLSAHAKYDPHYDHGTVLNCTIPEPCKNPSSVHKLRPENIRIVGALGDSLTAGNGIQADLIGGVLLQYRGLSFSIGGHGGLDYMVTLPNVLKKYNDDLVGFSTATGLESERCKSHLNVAVPGSVASDLHKQAKNLVSRLNTEHHTHPADDWKVITVFIGGNDLCDSCHKSGYEASDYTYHLRKALDYLHGHLSRVFVNLVTAPPVYQLHKYSKYLGCKIMYSTECPCVLPKHKSSYDALVVRTAQYHEAARVLVNSGRYDTREDFTVVVQPIMENITIPILPNGDIDFSFQAPDCFHFSQKGHESFARLLWNNMLLPTDKKTTHFSKADAKIPLSCPDPECPYLRTNRNSVKCEA